VFLDGVGNVDKDDIAVDISPHSVDVRVKNLNGTNYVYHIPRLYDEIIPSDSVLVCSISPCIYAFVPPCCGCSEKEVWNHQFWRVRANRLDLKLYKCTDDVWIQL
jgi:hypothetical protein